MKKTLLFIAAILMSVSVFAQTRATFLNEHFDGTSMPAGWTITGVGTSNWSISGSQNAGGVANELHLAWSPQFNGTSRVVMPAVDLTGVTSVVVSFKHALNNYSGSHTIGIATSSDNGATWNVGWQQNYNTSNSWEVIQNITTADMGQSSVMFSLFYTGSSYNINDWYFDDIEIFSQENLDLSLSSIDLNSVVPAGSQNIAVTVKNKGIETVNQVTMTYQFEGFDAVEETFTVNLASLASTQLSFAQPTMLLPGNYDLTVSITAVNGTDDDDPYNNTITKTIAATLGSTQKIAMIEHFSSSTCGPCVQPNNQMLTVTNNNPGKFTYTKYQMSWPGSGDPYYTEEGGVRRQYYNVNAVPAIFIEAQEKSAGQAQAVINDVYNTPAFADVRGSFNVNVNDNTITVKVDFMAFYDLNTAKAFVTVNEKETHGNVGTNGETSFHHIFMKFLTNTSGNELDIPAGGYQHFEFTQDLSSTHVEEMTDLEVSAWIQEYGTKEMLNSHFMYEYTDIHPYPVQNLAVAAEDGSLTATWEAPEGGNALSYNVYINGEMVQNTPDLAYSTTTTEEFNVVAVEAVYTTDMTSVKIAKATTAPASALTLSTTDIVFDEQYVEKYLTITNNTAAPVTISEIAENPETNYLALEIEGLIVLPYTLEVGESMQVNIAQWYFDAKEQVTTFINIVSTVGTQSVNVTVDSSWYDGVEEVGNSYEIYPNPTNGNIMVSGANINMVEVYNLCGQKVVSVNGAQNVNVDMSALESGVYMVKVIENNGNSTVNKVVKR
ncbi:MAG: T9SS type A sorting domain-containing protein [Bacteroidales bacterium]|nr:T9SS type A sorting domain-containing protein [Bacteroidales bacterium]